MAIRTRHQMLAALAASASCAALCSSSMAQAQTQPPAEAIAEFDISASDLDAALGAFMRQSHVQLIYTDASVRGRRAPALHGRLTPTAALNRLLTASDLDAQQTSQGVFVLKQRSGSTPSRKPGGEPTGTSPQAPVLPPATKSTEWPAPTSHSSASQTSPTSLGEVVVTGTLIRGAGPNISPIVTATRDDIDRSGRATLADYLSTLPQNFGGASTPATSLAGSDRLGTNSIVAQGVNLRGLGPSATLVLINGRRMAGAGLKGDFADVSSIPTAAIARVEVLLDGASAIYGSDAVGGVVNVILRKDFDGLETRGHASAAQGGAAESQFAQTLGKTWEGGHALLSYEYDHRDALASSTRDFTASSDLRRLGGTDHRQFYSLPGNVMALNPATGAYTPGWAIPPGQSGVALTPSSFLAGQENLDNQRRRTDILPDQTRNSVYASLGQALADRLEFNADARFSTRGFAYNLPGVIGLLRVNKNNPYFVSPNGAASNQIAYDYTGELGPQHEQGVSNSLGLSAGLDARIGRTWTIDTYVAYADELSRRYDRAHLNTYFLNEALGLIPTGAGSAYNPAQSGYFNPYGSGTANSQALLDFIGSGWVRTRFDSEVSSVNLKADGVVINLPGGDIKAAFGGQIRKERFQTETDSFVSKATPSISTEGPYERTVSAAFLELRVPLVGRNNAFPGVQRLEFSAAGRVERYSDVGATSNPKLGLLWAPAEGWSVRTSYGTSFRAPDLSDVYELQDFGPGILRYGSIQKLVLLEVGGNRGLKPEHARSWTSGIDFSPPRMSNLKLGITSFDTRFTNQISQPVANNIYNVLNDPIYAPFVHAVNPANPADLALIQSLLAQSTATTAGLFPANAYSAIVDARFLNTGGLHVRGVDASSMWAVALGADRLDLTANASWLLEYEQQVTPSAPWVRLGGLSGQPSRMRAQAAASWRHGDLATTLGLNFVAGSHSLTGAQVHSWTTADLQFLYRPSSNAAVAKDFEVALSVRNIFDTDPPFYDAPQGIGYDPANADPLGRVVSLQAVKRW